MFAKMRLAHLERKKRENEGFQASIDEEISYSDSGEKY